jgi:death-on-curing family protein
VRYVCNLHVKEGTLDFLHAEIEEEYRRWKSIVGVDDPYQSTDTIGLHEVLAAHFLIVDYFAEKKYGVGGVGPRSLDLLHSAVSRQFTGYGGTRKWKGLYENCATLMFGLIMNHPFHDANKRTALLATLSLLHRNRRIITLQQKKLDSLVISIAGNTLQTYFERDKRYQKKLQQLSGTAVADGIVYVIADFLQRNTRSRDNSARSVTYSELNMVLRGHGFELRSPNGNYINIVRVEPARPARFLGIGARPEREIFLGQIGFPGWKDQVSKSALKTVREKTRLTAQNGCDTQVLFEDAEPLSSLISEYAEPLKRLANK